MSPTAMEKLESQRASTKATLIWLETKHADHGVNPIDEETVDQYLQMVGETHRTAKEVHEKIVALNPADLAPHMVEYFSMLENVHKLLSGLKGIKATFPAPATAAGASVPGPTPRSTSMHLPKLQLPTFDGNIENWQSFHDMFSAGVISNTDLKNAQKLTYLKSLLTGEAARQIKSIALTDDNFDTAWTQLQHRYDNRRELLFAILRKFTEQKCLVGNSGKALRNLIDVSNECFSSLTALNLPVDKWDAILLYHMSSKLDNTTREMWEQTLTDTSIPGLKKLLKFLERRAGALAAGELSQPKPTPAQNPGRHGHGRVAHVHHVPASPTCNLCRESHSISRCPKFLSLTAQEKNETAKKLSLCFNCLRAGHSIANCPSRGTCRTCQGKHHTLLHKDKPAAKQGKGPNPEDVLNNHSREISRSQGMLATAVIKVRGHDGQFNYCRAFLDGGSTSSFITEACVRRLKLSRTPVSAEIRGLASTAIATAKGLVTLCIHSQFTGNPTYSIQTLILPRVTARLPVHPFDASSWPHLQGLQLADPKFNQPDNIDILLGADIFYDIFLNETRTGPPDCPTAIKTTLGWLVAGKINSKSTEVAVHYNDVDMERQLQKLWEIETVPTARSMTKEEKDCEAHFKSTHRVDEHGRFVVRLPLKTPQPPLGCSREIAVRRLKQLEGRFARAPERQEQYREFMHEYLTLGHMEEVPSSSSESNAQVCYIPHHFVLKESSTTTKLRVVFDASAKTSNGVALNDALMVGPTIQDNMSDILMRFRMHPIAFTADVAKMYRQVLVDKADTDLQRIVWRNSPSEPVKDYRLLTVTYGTGPAPFLATKALQQLAVNNNSSLPLACQTAMRDMYVDDLLSGSHNVERASVTVRQLMELMARGGMELRKWSTNSPALLETIPAELRETQTLLPLDSDPTIKALGVYWDPVRDTNSFKVTLNLTGQGKLLTKRNLLSQISTIFDPNGWISPVIIRGRILIQQLWKLQLGWDEIVPEHIQEEWISYRDNLHHLEAIVIPRCIIPAGRTHTKLVGFCDASEKAYAAVVYVVAYGHGEIPVVSLVTSKTRVAPAKTVSLPRLELCGAVLLAQLINTVQTNLGITALNTTLSSDSTVVLAWIQAHPSKWKTFVANRATEIQERAPDCQWNHVSGVENPADCASRGLDPSELKTHPLWWNGPSWLTTHRAPASHSLSESELAAVHSEGKNTVICSLAVPPENSMIRKYSSLRKLKRVAALAVRFCHNLLIKVQSKKLTFPTLLPERGPLTPFELNEGQFYWVRVVQAEQFPREIDSLQQLQPVHPKSPLCALKPFLDPSNVLRVGGRLCHAPLPSDQRQPALLPRHHHFTKLVIMSEHLMNSHAGPLAVLAHIHRQFWIIRARDAIRHQLKNCVRCTRVRGETLQQFMGDFPAARVTPSRPFLKCGVDYAGPFLVKPISPRSKITIKAYLAVFVCFATHAIHLEVVSSLSTPAFIASLHRFISRRGKPSDMYSDCGTNFVGAAREIAEATDLLGSQSHNVKLANTLSTEGIHWHFNPPGAPHVGGLWEAGVKSVKYHLKRVMGLARLTYEELATVIAQIEACLNSRPLTPISNDPDDLLALTPGHFLIGSPLNALPEIDLTRENTGRLSRWQQVQQLHQHFWHRWSNEFIARLQQRPKWLKQRTNIKIGDMVIIKHDQLPPLKWKLGRVTALHPGDDGLVRVVTLKTAEGELKRHIVKLCLLPIESTTTADSAGPADIDPQQ